MTRSISLDQPQRRHGGIVGGLLVCLILVGVIAAIGYKFIYDGRDGLAEGELIIRPVSRGSFDHIVLEQGEIESSSNTEVMCQVESRGYSGIPILWVIDEGAKVKKGDKLVELDSSTIEQELKESKIQVTTAEANVTSARALYQQAEITREEYLKGTYMTELATINSEIKTLGQELRRAELLRDSSARMVAKGIQDKLQLDAEEFNVENAKIKLEAAEQRKWVLENLTQKKMLVQFDSDIEAAAAQLSAFESELLEEQQELEEVERQMEACTMYAPSDGIVVHANRYSSRGGSAEFVVEPGASVRERQAIIRLPDPTQMQVKVNVNESRITLIKEGMPVKIRVDAVPGLKLTGRVKKVNRYAEPSSFFSSSIKEYATFIEIIEPPENIRTGMTAEAQIFVEQLPEALQVPIQGLYEHGGQMYCLAQRGPSKFDTLPVTIGATNDTMASIVDGVEEGDKIVLNLRSHLNLMDLPDVEIEDNSDMRKIRREPAAYVSEENPDGPSQVGGPGGRGPGGRGADGRGADGRGPGGPGGEGGFGGGRPGGGPDQGGFDAPRGGGEPGFGQGGRGGPQGAGGPRGQGGRDAAGGFGGRGEGGPGGGGARRGGAGPGRPDAGDRSPGGNEGGGQ